MCDPMSALAITSTAASLFAQQKAADAQGAANERQAANTMEAYRQNVAQSNLQQVQQQAQASQKLEQNNRAAAAAMARASVAAGENGVSGLSVDALLGDLATERDRYNDSVDTNYQSASGAIQSQRENLRANAQSQINALKTPVAPDYIGAGLRIGETVMRNPTASAKVKGWFN